MTGMIVYFNGQYMPKDEVRISPEDRGFVFADGIYEVMRAYDGHWFRAEEHFNRMARSLHALKIDGPKQDSFLSIADRLLQENDLRDAVFYIQITRGAAPRKHAFPDAATSPTIYATAYLPKPPQRQWDEGAAIILMPDLRWARCDIKSISLLPNVLASQEAKERGVEEAVFVRNGVITEGSHTNVCAVFDGVLHTYPLTNYILPGVTRTVVLELCDQLGIRYRETPIFEHAVKQADEVMILGTSTEVMPIVQVDDWTVADGKPGPVTRQLQEAFRAYAYASLAPQPNSV